MHVLECLNIEQELSLWLDFCYSVQDVRRVWLTLFLWSHFFVCVLESLSWNRKSDVLFTGFSPWEASDGAWDVCVVGGIRYVQWYVALTWLLGCQGFCFDLLSLLTCSHHLSTVLRVEVLTPQLLCLTAVWLSGFIFLPLYDFSLIAEVSILLYLVLLFMSI